MSTNNHEISLQQAVDMTTLYRDNKPANAPLCETFDVEAFSKLIQTPGCSSLRIYYGMKENLEIHAIIVAVNENGEDILPAGSSKTSGENPPVIIEDGYRCPPACPPRSPLN